MNVNIINFMGDNAVGDIAIVMFFFFLFLLIDIASVIIFLGYAPPVELYLNPL